jgi:ATP synthase F1 delta subunit
MFHAERWAGVFIAASGANANEAFLCLKALVPQIKTLDGVLLGHSGSEKLEKLLRESAAAAYTETPAVEYAIRFLCLLVEKNNFRYSGPLLQKIEQRLDERNGTLNAVLEAASSIDKGLEEKLTLIIKEKTGAANIKMKTCVRPELLAGYILRIGDRYIDASLKGQLESMAAHLGANTGGRNG